MNWFVLIILSALVGIFIGAKASKKSSLLLAGAVPCSGFQAFILYNMYFVPYQGGGAPMWLVAQVFGGAISFTVGALSFLLTYRQKNVG